MSNSTLREQLPEARKLLKEAEFFSIPDEAKEILSDNTSEHEIVTNGEYFIDVTPDKRMDNAVDTEEKDVLNAFFRMKNLRADLPVYRIHNHPLRPDDERLNGWTDEEKYAINAAASEDDFEVWRHGKAIGGGVYIPGEKEARIYHPANDMRTAVQPKYNRMLGTTIYKVGYEGEIPLGEFNYEPGMDVLFED